MSRARSLLTVVLLWAAIYLPWLGTSGLRSEEGHRVLPAVEMLASGNFLVPHVGGEIYLRKPPLINWLVAASFQLFGARNEWTARAPSISAVLILAVAFVLLPRRWLGARGSLLAAVAWLTSLGMMEKGRMIEIEAVYVALFGLAFLGWLSGQLGGRSPWLTWTGPWIFLGLGLLAKGPALLFFFYALVLAILFFMGKTRQLLHPAHAVGILLMLALFAAWAIPYSAAVRGAVVSQTWSSEFLGRFTGREGTWNDWLLNFPLAFAYFLPCGLLLLFVRLDRLPPEERPLARGLFWGATVPFWLVLLLPGAIQRYILPTLVPMFCLLGLAAKRNAFAWRTPSLRKAVVAAVIVIAFAAMIIFPLRSATVQKERPGFPQVAAPINAAVPPDATIYAVRPGFQPYLFYIRAPIRYLSTLADLPAEARYLVVPEKMEEEVIKDRASPRLLARTESVRGRATLVYALAP